MTNDGTKTEINSRKIFFILKKYNLRLILLPIIFSLGCLKYSYLFSPYWEGAIQLKVGFFDYRPIFTQEKIIYSISKINSSLMTRYDPETELLEIRFRSQNKEKIQIEMKNASVQILAEHEKIFKLLTYPLRQRINLLNDFQNSRKHNIQKLTQYENIQLQIEKNEIESQLTPPRTFPSMISSEIKYNLIHRRPTLIQIILLTSFLGFVYSFSIAYFYEEKKLSL